jgi:hypothetical protein
MKASFFTFTLIALLISSTQAQPSFSPFNPISVCGETVVYFVCQNVDAYHTITWHFGDDTKAYGKSVAHAYKNPGKYSVKLVVSRNGVIDSVVKADFVTIKPVPTSKFVIDQTGPLPAGIRFVNHSISNDAGFEGFSWEVNGQFVSDMEHLSYIFRTPAVYQISLKVVNHSGCIAVHTKQFEFQDNEVIPVGMRELAPHAISLFPNPASSMLQINMAQNSEVQYNIVDMQGKEVLSGTGTCINIEDLPVGPYLIFLQIGQITWSSRFHKSNM